MKTQSVSFQGGLYVHSAQPEVKSAINNSSAMRMLGRFYNANIAQVDIASRSKKGVVYSGLCIDNIKPKNIFVTFYDFVTGRGAKRCEQIYFNSGKETPNGLVEVLRQMKKNSFVKMIIRK